MPEPSGLEAELRQELGYDPVALSFTELHPNLHFRAGPYFVKVLLGKPQYFDNETSAHEVLPPDVPVPALRLAGRSRTGQAWIAFEWQDLDPVVPTAGVAAQAGELLGRLHAHPIGDSGLVPQEIADISPCVTDLAQQISQYDLALSQRITALQRALPPAVEADGYRCLIHGDFGWRNLKLDPAGKLWLIDFEHARSGHPWLEFAKLWDRELADPAIRDVFCQAYARGSGRPAPTDRELLLIRLWAAAAIFPYAWAQSDVEFADHGLAILDRVEASLDGEVGGR